MNKFQQLGAKVIEYFTPPQDQQSTPKSALTGGLDFYDQSLYNLVPFDGEKTPYELGNPYDYYLDYYALRARSWEAFLKSDVIQNAIRKYLLWIVGSGLKINAEPLEEILKKHDISLDREQFVEQVEVNFRMYANSKQSSHNELMSIHVMGIEALKNAMISGDVLVIQRLRQGRITTEIIDGVYIRTPIGSGYETEANKRGNRIEMGVELDKRGRHVAYYIYNDAGNYTRIAAVGERTKRRQAWLMYGLRHKINDVRGMSLMTAVLETSAKMDRYKEATIGQAEENSKIPYTIEHGRDSDGENPLVRQTLQSMGRQKGTAPETDSTIEGQNIATKVAATTGKMAYNLPRDSKLVRNMFNNDPQFKDFFEVNTDIVYATLGIPPEVAMDKFGGSYSSSRAALKAWEHKMKVDRMNTMSEEYYKPIFRYWFDVNVFQNNIDAPGYLELLQTGNFYAKEAYLNVRFIGANIPHIDPLKEVNAVRKKLGAKYDNVPLIHGDRAMEELDSGDFNSTIKKARNEQDLASDFNDDPDPDGNAGQGANPIPGGNSERE